MKKKLCVLSVAFLMALSSFADRPVTASDLRISKASVTPANDVELSIYKYAGLEASEIRILRAIEEFGPFERIGVIAMPDQEIFSFTDTEVSPEKSRYYYTLEAVSSDGNTSWMSHRISTIHLKATTLDNTSNEIVWNDFESYYGYAAAEYKLYRIVDGITDPVPIFTAMTGNVYHLDNIGHLTHAGERIGYLVLAIIHPDGGNNSDTVRSNISITEERTRVYLPNAFSPKGRNNSYTPMTSFVNQSEYSFRVYNRWGQIVFDTNNPSEGWNGKYKDEYVPAGAYVYFLRFRTQAGEEFQKNGTITVVY